jgi:hypothetical protein
VVTHPASHDEALDRVMRVIDLFGARPELSDEEAVAALVRDGVGEVDAELLVRFVPCGLSFALLKILGLTRFPSTYQVQNAAGLWVELPLAAEHYFSAALSVGYDVTTRGYTEWVSKAVFQAVTLRSAEMNVVNQYFESGGTREGLAGSTLSPPTFIGLSAEQIAAGR